MEIFILFQQKSLHIIPTAKVLKKNPCNKITVDSTTTIGLMLTKNSLCLKKYSIYSKLGL